MALSAGSLCSTWTGRWSATPIIIGDLIFVSAEYGPGAAVLRVDGSSLTELWASDDVLSNHYSTSVFRAGYLFGFHGRQEYGPSFRAVELRTGKVRWSEHRFKAGSVILAGDRLLILRETGEFILAPASPDDLFVYEYEWSPDGTAFAATGAHGSGDDNWWSAELFLVPVSGGVARSECE